MSAMAASRTAFLIVATTFLFLNSNAISTHKSGEPLQFTYFGAKGPDRWGSLNSNFSTCADGKSQSPINILKGKVVFNNTLKPLISSYDSANVTLVNNEFSVGLHYPEHSGGLIVDGKMYHLEQIHWHTPSEHRINGLQYAAELHLVHVSEDKNVSVVAVLFKYGPPDPLVAKIQNKLNELATYKAKRREEAQITIGCFHSKLLSKRARKYYRYIGSFTTPPCTENVVWHVLGKVRSISRDQVEALKAPLDKRCKNNARPCQPMNGRQVEIYEDTPIANRDQSYTKNKCK